MIKILLLIILLISFDVRSEMTVKDYLTSPENDYMKLYISGIGQGLSWSNSMLESLKQKKLYCEPPKLSLNYQNYKNILDDTIKNLNKEDFEKITVGLTLTMGLMKTFPCK